VDLEVEVVGIYLGSEEEVGTVEEAEALSKAIQEVADHTLKQWEVKILEKLQTTNRDS